MTEYVNTATRHFAGLAPEILACASLVERETGLDVKIVSIAEDVSDGSKYICHELIIDDVLMCQTEDTAFLHGRLLGYQEGWHDHRTREHGNKARREATDGATV